MPIMATAPTPPPLTAEVVKAVMDAQKACCAPSTWDRFVKSLAANGFRLPVQ